MAAHILTSILTNGALGVFAGSAVGAHFVSLYNETDSCLNALDGTCDVPEYCSHTDCTDCNTCNVTTEEFNFNLYDGTKNSIQNVLLGILLFGMTSTIWLAVFDKRLYEKKRANYTRAFMLTIMIGFISIPVSLHVSHFSSNTRANFFCLFFEIFGVILLCHTWISDLMPRACMIAACAFSFSAWASRTIVRHLFGGASNDEIESIFNDIGMRGTSGFGSFMILSGAASYLWFASLRHGMARNMRTASMIIFHACIALPFASFSFVDANYAISMGTRSINTHIVDEAKISFLFALIILGVTYFLLFAQ